MDGFQHLAEVRANPVVRSNWRKMSSQRRR